MTDQPEKLDLTSHNLPADKTAELLRLFPEIRTEGGQIDFDKLKLALGQSIDVGRERYGMNWPGKAECFKTIQTPSMGTLLPVPAESVDFDTTENLIIEGDNLEALKLLQKAYLGKVKMIYIDPPYNTGNDFIYPDNYAESLQTYLQYTNQVDAEGRKFGTNSDTDGRFHSRWLNMMYPRLYLARNLLRDDGVVFVSIDEVELNNLRLLMNEIFGEENFVECLVWNKRIPKNDKNIGSVHEYILVYVKNNNVSLRFTMPKGGIEEINDLRNSWIENKLSIPECEKQLRKLYADNDYERGITLYNSVANDYRIWGKINLSWPNANTFGPRYEIIHPKTKKPVGVPDRGWRWKEDTFNGYLDNANLVELPNGSFVSGRIWFDVSETTQPSFVKYLDEVETLLLRSVISLKSDGGIEVEELFGNKSMFSYPKPTSLIKMLVNSVELMNDDIVLDFFAGSYTTAQAVLELNREHNDNSNQHFIMIQLPEITGNKEFSTITNIGKERVRRVIQRMNDKEVGQLPSMNVKQDRGFRVFKLAESNFKAWDASAPKDKSALEKQLEMHIEHIRDGRTSEDMLYEILLKSGFPLTTPVEKVEVAGKSAYSVAGGGMLICLEKELTLEAVRAMAEMKPQRVVCLDLGFADNDQLKTNAVQIFKNKEIVFKTV